MISTKSYLHKTYTNNNNTIQDIINNIISRFELNSEQERAFRIVENHATTTHSGRLSMYLGGMGGTGKSQVINALMQFFSD